MKIGGMLTQRVVFGLLLILLSVFFYALHYAVFRDAHHIFLYMVGDIAFVFIELLMVTLIIHQILSEREKRSLRKKLHMVIGAFFSEVGTRLLKFFDAFDRGTDKLNKDLIVGNDWSPEHFTLIREQLRGHRYKIDSRTGDLAGDIERAYKLLVREWLSHMEHLKGHYPYLFSLALRTNPFDPDASPQVA